MPANATPANASLGEASARAAPNLTLVPPPILSAGPGARASALFAEARTMSLDHLSALAAEMTVVLELLEAVIDAGDLYVPGVRDFSMRLSEDLFWRSKTLEVLSTRQAAAIRPASALTIA